MLLSWTKWRLIVFFENAGKENLQLSSFVEALQIEALVSMLLFLYMNRGFLGIFRIAYGKSDCTFYDARPVFIIDDYVCCNSGHPITRGNMTVPAFRWDYHTALLLSSSSFLFSGQIVTLLVPWACLGFSSIRWFVHSTPTCIYALITSLGPLVCKFIM